MHLLRRYRKPLLLRASLALALLGTIGGAHRVTVARLNARLTRQALAPLPGCAHAEQPAPLADGFPANLPMPPGAVVIQSYALPNVGKLQTTLVVGLPQPDVLAFYRNNLPWALYRTVTDQAVSGREANEASREAGAVTFAGHGWRGAAELGTPADCPVTVVQLLLRRQ